MILKQKYYIAIAVLISLSNTRCASLGGAFGINSKPTSSKISNPFTDYQPKANNDLNKTVILRTKNGDHTIELELPDNSQNPGDIILPLNKNSFSSSGLSKGRPTDPTGMIDESYKNHPPTLSDREILKNNAKDLGIDETQRHEIEESLMLIPSEDNIPESSSSYLGGIDHIKQLYRLARFEAALVETDSMIRQYPTDATLYEMKGTLLDRLGKRDLAIQSWNQSLRFNSNNIRLKQFLIRHKSLNIAAGGSP